MQSKMPLDLGKTEHTLRLMNCTKFHRVITIISLSKLPLEVKSYDKPSVDMFHMEQFDFLPVTSEIVKSATRKDPLLSKVYDVTMQGWPETAPEGLVTFHNQRNELSVHHGCVMWGLELWYHRSYGRSC